MTILLIGNKTDLVEKRQVTTEEGKQFADRNGLLFLETSAKTSFNVDEAFLKTARGIFTKIQSGELDNNVMTGKALAGPGGPGYKATGSTGRGGTTSSNSNSNASSNSNGRGNNKTGEKGGCCGDSWKKEKQKKTKNKQKTKNKKIQLFPPFFSPVWREMRNGGKYENNLNTVPEQIFCFYCGMRIFDPSSSRKKTSIQVKKFFLDKKNRTEN